jgi:hypothetical protein
MKKILLMLFILSTITQIIQAQVAPFKKGEKVAITKFDFADKAGVFNEQTATCCGEGDEAAEVRTVEAIVRSAEALLKEKYKIDVEPTEVKPNPNPKVKFKEEAKTLPMISAKDAAKMGYDKFIEMYVTFDASAGAALGMGIVRLGTGKAKIKVMYKIYDGKGKLISFSKPETAKGSERYKVRGFMIPGAHNGTAVKGSSYMIKPNKSFPGDEYVILFQEAFSECLGLK